MERTMHDLIKEKSAEILDEIIAIREHLHAHPELSFKEFKTSAFVQEKLTDWQINFTTGWVETGIVALIEPEGNYDKCIGLRADMDALPIQEMNNVDYKSKNDGIMHACGHDVHTAMLLGASKIINDMRSELKHAVKLIFQPGEEKLPGGAKLMIDAGVLNEPKVDEIYALHVFPELEVGKIGLRPGMYMASCDEIYITVNGKGGHGAMPHLNIDPIAISAQLIVSLQQIVSRNCPPAIPSVLSFGRIEGLGATNVIPDKVELQGTFRTMDEDWRAEAHRLITKQSQLLVESFGGTIDIEIRKGYPYLENHPELTAALKSKASSFFGHDNVVDLPIRLTGEDFAYFGQVIPATFTRIGVKNEESGIVYPVHHSQFDIDNDALLIGMQTLLTIVFC